MNQSLSLRVCAVTFALAAGEHLHAQLQTQLEVNLGPINMHWYDGVFPNANDQGIASGPNIPACSFGSGPPSNYRTCMQFILNDYAHQGVVGVRFQYESNAPTDPPRAAGEDPFLDQAGTPDPVFYRNLSLFLQDLRAANMQYVSFSPGWHPDHTGYQTIYGCVSGSAGSYSITFATNCQSQNGDRSVFFYPWSPWAIDSTSGGPLDAGMINSYDNVPQLTFTTLYHPWPWSSSSGPLYNHFNGIFSAVAAAQLQVREYDLFGEIPMWLSAVYGRMAYDNVQLVHPLEVINQIMHDNGLARTATMSTAAFNTNADCKWIYGNDSAIVANASLLVSAEIGGVFGAAADTGSVCGSGLSSDQHSGHPPYVHGTVDFHNYPADVVNDPVWGWIHDPNSMGCQTYPDNGAPVTLSNESQNCPDDTVPGNPTGSSQTAAKTIYNAIYNYYSTPPPGYNFTSLIIGETDEYNPGGFGRDGIYFPPLTDGTSCTSYGPYPTLLFDTVLDPGTHALHYINNDCKPDWKWHAPWSSASASVSAAASDNVAGLKLATGINNSSVVIRPWEPVGWGTVLSPAPLSGSTDRPYYVGSCNIPAPQAPQVPAGGGPVTISVSAPSGCRWSVGPVPNLTPLTWSSDNITSATVNGQYCFYPGQAGSNCWGTGAGSTTLTFSANSGSTRYVNVLVAGTTLTITQLGAPAPAKFTEIGVFRGASGYYIVDQDGNNFYDVPGDRTETFGQLGDIPVAGDWDGSGKIRIGVFRPATAHWYLDLNNNGIWDGTPTDLDIQFGNPTANCNPSSAAGLAGCLDIPVVGDWAGIGVSRLGIFQNGQFFLDNQNPTVAGAHNWYTTYNFGQPLDIPVANNWNNTGSNAGLKDQIGVYRKGTWYVNATGDGVFHPNDPVYYFGGGGDIPVVGNWSGNSNTPKRIGVFSSIAQWWVDINNDHTFTSGIDQTYSFGQSGDLPAVGTWTLP